MSTLNDPVCRFQSNGEEVEWAHVLLTRGTYVIAAVWGRHYIEYDYISTLGV